MTGIVAQNVGRTSGLIKSAGGGGGVWTLIKTLTASSSSTLSFVDGTSDVVLDSTYPIYVFKFINIHPSANGNQFQFNMSIDSGSNYNVAKTSSMFYAAHKEDDSNQGLSYGDGYDLAQGTGAQALTDSTSDDNDGSASGELRIFNPSSTTFVKHYYATVNFLFSNGTYTWQEFTAGYGNTTSAVDAIQFTMSSGNIDAGKIKLYGLGDS